MICNLYNLHGLCQNDHFFCLSKTSVCIRREFAAPASETKILKMENTDNISGHNLQPLETNKVSLKVGETTMEEADPVVIGGMVLDIHATPSILPSARSTTPGKVHYVLGGVARNIAECMSKLGTRPYMISAVGIDMAGKLLLEHWNSAGQSTKGIRKHQEISTAVICIIFDRDGELTSGVASMEAIEKFLSPSWILQSKSNICASPILVVDANLNPSSLEISCQVAAESNIPVWFEPVSVAKSRRITSVAKYVSFASPNEIELITMANALSCEDMFHPIEKDSSKIPTEYLFQMLKPAVLVLLEKGIKMVVVTLGADGVFLCTREPKLLRTRLERTKRHGFSGQLYEAITSSCCLSRFSSPMQSEGSSHLVAMHFPALSASVMRLTGAGDCLVGGTIAALCSGLNVMQSLAVGIAVAKSAVETETNVPSAFSLSSIADDAKSVYSTAKVLFHQSML